MATKPMTKSKIVAEFADSMQVSKKEACAWFDKLAEVSVRETKKAGQFVIPGIGKLVKSVRKARMGRNPQTGEAIKIPRKTVVKFRVAKACRDSVVPPKK